MRWPDRAALERESCVVYVESAAQRIGSVVFPCRLIFYDTPSWRGPSAAGPKCRYNKAFSML